MLWVFPYVLIQKIGKENGLRFLTPSFYWAVLNESPGILETRHHEGSRGWERAARSWSVKSPEPPPGHVKLWGGRETFDPRDTQAPIHVHAYCESGDLGDPERALLAKQCPSQLIAPWLRAGFFVLFCFSLFWVRDFLLSGRYYANKPPTLLLGQPCPVLSSHSTAPPPPPNPLPLLSLWLKDGDLIAGVRFQPACGHSTFGRCLEILPGKKKKKEERGQAGGLVKSSLVTPSHTTSGKMWSPRAAALLPSCLSRCLGEWEVTSLFLARGCHNRPPLCFIQGRRQALWKFVNTDFLSRVGAVFLQKEKNSPACWGVHIVVEKKDNVLWLSSLC